MIVRTPDSSTVTSVVWSASVESTALPAAGPIRPCPLPSGASAPGQPTSSLAHLGRERVGGAVRVVGAGDVGVVLLRDGVVLGAYSGRLPELDDAEVLLGLAAAPEAEVDVHTTAEIELSGFPAGDLVWSRLTAPRRRRAVAATEVAAETAGEREAG